MRFARRCRVRTAGSSGRPGCTRRASLFARPAFTGGASGVINTVQRLGSATGIPVTGTVFFSTLTPTSRSAAAIDKAFTHSAACAMAVNVTLSVTALLLVFALPKQAASRR
jgi:hypothetical protein